MKLVDIYFYKSLSIKHILNIAYINKLINSITQNKIIKQMESGILTTKAQKINYNQEQQTANDNNSNNGLTEALNCIKSVTILVTH